MALVSAGTVLRLLSPCVASDYDAGDHDTDSHLHAVLVTASKTPRSDCSWFINDSPRLPIMLCRLAGMLATQVFRCFFRLTSSTDPCGPVYETLAGIEDSRPADRHCRCVAGYPKKVGHVAKRFDNKAIGAGLQFAEAGNHYGAPAQAGGARAAIQGVARAAMVQAQEAALLLSVAATAPLRLARGAGPQTVCRRT